MLPFIGKTSQPSRATTPPLPTKVHHKPGRCTPLTPHCLARSSTRRHVYKSPECSRHGIADHAYTKVGTGLILQQRLHTCSLYAFAINDELASHMLKHETGQMHSACSRRDFVYFREALAKDAPANDDEDHPYPTNWLSAKIRLPLSRYYS